MSDLVADRPVRHALILDFDGVLVDSEPVHFAAWKRAFEQLTAYRLPDAATHHVMVGLGLEQIYRVWTQDELTPTLKQQLLQHKTGHFFEMGAELLKPMPGSLELIQRAHIEGWYIAIVSHALRQRLHRTLAVMQMPALFDLILAGEDARDAANHKDHARAARVFGIDPANCVVIEDSPSGIADAVAVGIGHVIGLTSSFDADILTQAGAHQVVHHLDQVRLTAELRAEV